MNTSTLLCSSTSSIEDAVTKGASILKNGELVAFPTETVYGLGADATNSAAVLSIYQAKGRPSNNPLIVHVCNFEMALRSSDITDPAMKLVFEKLATKFWPGPLTMVVPRATGISPSVSAGLSTVALRWPSHQIAQQLIAKLDRPVAAPSANRSGFTSPTTAQHVFAELSGRIPLILDGGPCFVGLESTVLDITRSPPAVLRPGAVTAEMLSDELGYQVISHSHAPVHTAGGAPAPSPGMLSSHYAPRAPAARFTKAHWQDVCASTLMKAGKLVLITLDTSLAFTAPNETMLLPQDAAGYAHALYSSLRDADVLNPAAILVLEPPETSGLWAAVHDRLRRATKELPDVEADIQSK